MNLIKYEEIINKTAVYPKKVDDAGLYYCLVGLFDEIDEVKEKILDGESEESINKELGDVVWYLCALCNELGISFNKVITERKELDEREFRVELLYGIVKKHYRDNKPIDKEKVYYILSNFAFGILDHLPEEEILKILEDNYNKLMLRRETNTLHGDGDNREQDGNS